MKMKMVLPHTPEGAEALSPGLLRMIALQVGCSKSINFSTRFLRRNTS